MPSGVRVRGVCAAGHTVETTAAGKRVTWQGPCPSPTSAGQCGLPVNARKIAPEHIAPPAGSQPAVNPDSPYRVLKVESFADPDHTPSRKPAAGAQHAAAGITVEHPAAPAGDPGSGNPHPGGPGAVEPDQLPDPIAADGQRAGIGGRLRGRLAGPARPAGGNYRHPLTGR